MNIVFFNSPLGTSKLSFMITSKTVDDLKKEGTIPKESVTLLKKYQENMSDMDKAILVHIDKTLFDNYKKPTEVVFDLDLVRMFFLEMYRSVRGDILKDLDSLQIRALAKGMTDVVSEIEIDKNALRNLPNVVMDKIKNLDCFFKINKVIPQELLVDYIEKYGYRLK
jgi:hypothetical protein